MKLRSVFAAFAAVAMLFSVGCEENGVDGNKPANLTLSTTEVTVDHLGGVQQVTYEITNPQAGAVVLGNCVVDWIKDLSTATEGVVKFTVEPNHTSRAREATIVVQYTAIADAAFNITVKQAASSAPVFTYNIVKNEPTAIELDVTPADQETAYICRIHTREYIETFGLTNDAALFSNEMAAFDTEARYSGQTTLNYIRNISYNGIAKNVYFEGLTPDTDYVIYSYHIDLNNSQLASDVYREDIRTAKPTTLDVDFEMSFEVNGAQVKQTITPSDQEVAYYTECWSVSDFYSYYGNGADMAETFVAKWNENVAIKRNMGNEPYQIINEYGKVGTQTIEHTSLMADTEYVFYVFALNPETAFAASDIVIERVTTESAQVSTMTIDIRVEDIYATTANVYWTASDPEGKFARSVMTKAEFDALGSTEEAKLETLVNDFWLYQAYGYTDMNLSGLTPNTLYVAFAYGLDGETPNTRIFTTEFTTKSNTLGTANISVSWDCFYNIDEAAEVDPGHWGGFAGWDDYALIPVKISGVTDNDEVYWMVSQRPLDYYNSDDEWIRDLTSNDFYCQEVRSTCYLQLPYEKEYTLVAVAKDANGNFGRVFKVDIYLYKSDAANIANYEYVEEK